jgi:hypothetical protein
MEKPSIKLSGTDGNVFSIISKVKKALERAGLKKESTKFSEEVEQTDYDGVLRLAMKYCDVN